MSQVRFYPNTFKLPQPILTAKDEYYERHGVVLEATLPSGAIVFGEASPLPGFSPESLADVLAAMPEAVALVERQLNVVLNNNWSTPFAALDVLGTAFATLPSLRFALECLLLQAMAKSKAIDLAGLLVRSPRPDVPRNIALGISKQSELLALPHLLEQTVALWRNQEISTFKLKLSPDSLQTTFSLAEILRQLLPDCELRLDANQSFTQTSWLNAATIFASLEIKFIEEPVADPTPEIFHTLLDASAIKIALDESLLSPAIYSWLTASKPALGALVLKPSLLGGIAAVWRLAEIATNAGIPIVISSLLEGAVASEANLEIAKAVPGTVLACGLGE